MSATTVFAVESSLSFFQKSRQSNCLRLDFNDSSVRSGEEVFRDFSLVGEDWHLKDCVSSFVGGCY